MWTDSAASLFWDNGGLCPWPTVIIPHVCDWITATAVVDPPALCLIDACDQLFLKEVKLKLFYAKDEEFVQIFIDTVPSELPSRNCGKFEMENCIRSFSMLFFFKLHFCVNLTEENAVLGWEDFFLSDVNNIFIFVCWPLELWHYLQCNVVHDSWWECTQVFLFF